MKPKVYTAPTSELSTQEYQDCRGEQGAREWFFLFFGGGGGGRRAAGGGGAQHAQHGWHAAANPACMICLGWHRAAAMPSAAKVSCTVPPVALSSLHQFEDDWALDSHAAAGKRLLQIESGE